MGTGLPGRLYVVGGVPGRDRPATACRCHPAVVEAAGAAPTVNLLGVATSPGPANEQLGSNIATFFSDTAFSCPGERFGSLSPRRGICCLASHR